MTVSAANRKRGMTLDELEEAVKRARDGGYTGIAGVTLNLRTHIKEITFEEKESES